MLVVCCSEGDNCIGTNEAQGKDWRMTYPSCKAIWPYPQRQLGRCVKVVTDDRQGAKRV